MFSCFSDCVYDGRIFVCYFIRDAIYHLLKEEIQLEYVFLSREVTKIVYFIGNEHMLIAHDSNRLRFS